MRIRNFSLKEIELELHIHWSRVAKFTKDSFDKKGNYVGEPVVEG